MYRSWQQEFKMHTAHQLDVALPYAFFRRGFLATAYCLGGDLVETRKRLRSSEDESTKRICAQTDRSTRWRWVRTHSMKCLPHIPFLRTSRSHPTCPLLRCGTNVIPCCS